MTAFGWKRKAGGNLIKNVPTLDNETEDENVSMKLPDVKRFKRKKLLSQADQKLQFEQFKAEGIKLAEQQRFRAAIVQWDKALEIVPTDVKVLEMIAQALLQLQCYFSAIQTAEKAIKFNPCWWVAYQTLGRAHLSIGDPEMAKRSFCKAIHLNPTESELWEEDLNWTLSLFKKKLTLQTSKNSENEVKEMHCIKYDEDGYIENCDTAEESNR